MKEFKYEIVKNDDHPRMIHFYNKTKNKVVINNKIIKIMIEWTEQFGDAVQISSIEQFSTQFYLTEYPDFRVESSVEQNDKGGMLIEAYTFDGEKYQEEIKLDIYDKLLYLSLKKTFDKHGIELVNIITDRSRALGITLNFGQYEWVQVFY